MWSWSGHGDDGQPHPLEAAPGQARKPRHQPRPPLAVTRQCRGGVEWKRGGEKMRERGRENEREGERERSEDSTSYSTQSKNDGEFDK